MEVRPKIEWDVTEWERPSTSGQAAQQQQEKPLPLPQQKEGDEEEEEGADDLHDDIEDNEQLNEALRSYATDYNLTTQKVKNIIFHIVKNPQTFATLIRKDPDAMAGLRLTRSRLRQLEHIAKRKIPPVELKPIRVPKTFLDVNYGEEEEEEDTDYQPGNDTTVEAEKDLTPCSSTDEEDGEEEELAILNQSTAGKAEDVTTKAREEGGGRTSAAEEFLTEVDNPIYPMFIRSVMGTNEEELDAEKQLYNEEDDPEYMFQEFDDLCAEGEEEDEYDEFRRDRATEIPRWELKALEQDFVEVPTALDVPIDLESRPQSKQSSSFPRPSFESRATGSDGMQQGQGATSTTPAPAQMASSGEGPHSTDTSCSLLEPPDRLKFTEEDFKAIKVQLEKHVQLLCQCVVGSAQHPELVDTRNSAVQMLTELSEQYKEAAGLPHSLFHISNLQAAVFSAHDIEACQRVDLPLKERSESHPSLETMWVLARSEACRYHDLLPRHSFAHPQPVINFLPSEQLLLALGLFQLHHVPHASKSRSKTAALQRGKYPLIVEYFVPGKTLLQIKNHLKNIRSCPSPTVMHRIIWQAERGIFDVKYRPDLGEDACPDIPLHWPPEKQPYWLKSLAAVFQDGKLEIKALTMGRGRGGGGEQAEEEGAGTAAAGAMQNDSNTTAAVGEEEPRQVKRKRGGEGGTEERGLARKQLRRDEWTLPEEDGEEEEAMEGMELAEEQHPEVLLREEQLKRGGHSSPNGTEEAPYVLGEEETTGSSNDQPTAAPLDFASIAEGPSAEDEDVLLVDEQQNGSEGADASAQVAQPQPQQKKSRRKQRAERGIAALQSAETRELTMRALVEAVYADFKQRMFMHQDKLRAVQSILVRPDLSFAERFSLLWDQLGQSHPQLFFLFAAIAPEHELPPSLRAHPERVASKQALRMVHTIQTYMSGSRSAAHMKNTFKFLKEAPEAMGSEDKLFEALQRHFGIRDEPLWRLLRREWMSARCNDKVEDWQFECLDLDRLQADPKAMAESCQFEQVSLPYRHDPTERSRLRLRHGRVTMELSGRLRNVTIEYSKDKPQSKAKELADKSASSNEGPLAHGTPSTSSARSTTTAFKIPQSSARWTRPMDAALLLGYSDSGGERQKCIAKFLASPLGRHMSRAEVEGRLQSLVSVANQLKKTPAMRNST